MRVTFLKKEASLSPCGGATHTPGTTEKGGGKDLSSSVLLSFQKKMVLLCPPNSLSGGICWVMTLKPPALTVDWVTGGETYRGTQRTPAGSPGVPHAPPAVSSSRCACVESQKPPGGGGGGCTGDTTSHPSTCNRLGLGPTAHWLNWEARGGGAPEQLLHRHRVVDQFVDDLLVPRLNGVVP